jgi:hypothetical protein
MAADFEVFYIRLGDTSIYQTFIQDSTNTDAVSFLVNAVSGDDRYPTDFTTLHDYWNAIREELQESLDLVFEENSAIALGLKAIASTAQMEFTFDDDGYVTYI